MASAYNTRPRSKNMYKDGKKRSLFVRTLMWIFPHKGDNLLEAARKVIFFCALISFVYFGGSVLFDIGHDYYQQYKVDKKMREFHAGNVNLSDEDVRNVLERHPDILGEYIAPYNFNNDFVGHVTIPSASAWNDSSKYLLDYFVYQTTNNDYYLDRAFDHSPSIGGAIFADYRNQFAGGALSGNTVLYGHNIMTGNYFSKVSNYYRIYEKQDISFYKTYPLITFNTLYEINHWKVFAAVLFNTEERYGEVYRYNFPEFKDKDDFNSFILDIMDRSVLFTDVDLQYGDHILTLSTCYYPYSAGLGTVESTRAVVFARKVRPGEDPNVDTSKATINNKLKPFELQGQRMGNFWTGRVWDTSYLLSYNGE